MYEQRMEIADKADAWGLVFFSDCMFRWVISGHQKMYINIHWQNFSPRIKTHCSFNKVTFQADQQTPYFTKSDFMHGSFSSDCFYLLFVLGFFFFFIPSCLLLLLFITCNFTLPFALSIKPLFQESFTQDFTSSNISSPNPSGVVWRNRSWDSGRQGSLTGSSWLRVRAKLCPWSPHWWNDELIALLLWFL